MLFTLDPAQSDRPRSRSDWSWLAGRAGFSPGPIWPGSVAETLASAGSSVRCLDKTALRCRARRCLSSARTFCTGEIANLLAGRSRSGLGQARRVQSHQATLPAFAGVQATVCWVVWLLRCTGSEARVSVEHFFVTKSAARPASH
jgi:hypothetical protein